MKNILKLAIAFMALFSFAACSDVPMPYDEPGTSNNDNDSTTTGTYLNETFETSFGKFTNVTVKGNAWVIDFKTAKATGYESSSKTTTASEAYLVSSPVDLTKSTAAYLQFDYILRYVRAGQTENKVLITSNYTGDPSTTTWTDITGTLTEGSDWNTFSTYKKNIPSDFLGKNNVVIALMYSCTTSSSTIEVKNLIMKDGTVDESGETPVTPTTGEAKGSGTEADPYNAAGANKAAAALSSSDKKENVYVSGIISKVGDFNEKFGEVNYYISDDGTENGDQFYVYGGLGKDGAKFTSATDLKVGQKVTVVGTLINFKGNTPEFQYGSKIVSIEGSGTTTPDTPTSGEAVSISGTTVTLTNSAATAGSETATLDLNSLGYSNQQVVSEVSFSDGTKLTFAKGKGTTDPTFYTATKGVRVYLNNTMTFSASKPIAKIVFTCDAYKGTNEVGNKTATMTFSGNTAVYTNADPSLTKGGVQLRVQTITITYAK
jgi:hypothetical protein